MSVRNLFEQAPHLCGAKNADKHAAVAGVIWDHEKAGKGFSRQHGETARGRIGFLFDWDCEFPEKREYCLALGELAVLAHYAKDHGDHEAGVTAKALAVDLEAKEAAYPDVAQVLSVETAARGWWDA